MRPGPEVLAAFGVSAEPVPLPGGEGTTWRAGEIVLKPAGPPRAARWTADLYDSLAGRPDPGFRVPRPVRAASGDWLAVGPPASPLAVGPPAGPLALGPAASPLAAGPQAAGPAVGGWVAWEWLPGEPADWSGVSPCWPRLIAASEAFHRALAGRPAPSWLGRDGSPWTVSDQVAWGDRDPWRILAATPGPLRGQVRRLLAALRPVRLPGQLVHGDLGGNVLFADGEPPAVIDFSPYWRPAGLALAVAAVDALLWSGADAIILDQLGSQPELDQLLARALVYRLVTEMIFRRDNRAGLEAAAQAGRPVTDLILARLALGSAESVFRPARDDHDFRAPRLPLAPTGVPCSSAGTSSHVSVCPRTLPKRHEWSIVAVPAAAMLHRCRFPPGVGADPGTRAGQAGQRGRRGERDWGGPAPGVGRPARCDSSGT